MDYQHKKVDILVVGGAITGLEAAIIAKSQAPDLDVAVLDKGKAGYTGCAHWGGGDITYVTQEDDLAGLVTHYTSCGDGLADPAWVEMALVESYPRVQEMAEWGVPFERDKAAFTGFSSKHGTETYVYL